MSLFPFLTIGGGGSCGNKRSDGDCQSFKSRGFCAHTWVQYMKDNCAKTCGLCGESQIIMENTVAPAYRFYQRMIVELFEILGSSTGNQCTKQNKRSDGDCQYFKSRGYCAHTYVQFMKDNCAKTCGC